MKPPRLLLNDLYAFSPNRETLGGTAYFIIKKTGNILVDSPPWLEETKEFFLNSGGIRWFYLTHRGGISKEIDQIHKTFNCEIVIQEQEAYLLPEIPLTSFESEITLTDQTQGIWTPGFSPGSSCLYDSSHGGILFTGRHLLPDQNGKVKPLQLPKTFHWQRQLNSVKLLEERFNPHNLQYIFPATNTGFLRGKGFVRDAYQYLKEDK
jgi:glyoxylase-like metal-dependent hydrolase (beta-lactamase superfamily II)